MSVTNQNLLSKSESLSSILLRVAANELCICVPFAADEINYQLLPGPSDASGALVALVFVGNGFWSCG